LPIFLKLAAKDPADWNSLYLEGQCYCGRIYSTVIGNLGTVLEMFGRQDEVMKHIEEAEEFLARAQKEGL